VALRQVSSFRLLYDTAGKTTVCEVILEKLQNQRVATISLDSYYKALELEEIEAAHNMNYNFGEFFFES
jgi:uridine kinase